MSTHGEALALDPYARWDAWEPVLAAIEEAIDTVGLPPADRRALAEMHNDAGTWLGKKPVTTDGGALLELDDYTTAKQEGGIFDLEFPAGHRTLVWVLKRAGILTIEQLRAMSDDEILAIHRVGPLRLQVIRLALLRHDALTGEAI